MGEARRRGDFSQRKKEALEAGRFKEQPLDEKIVRQVTREMNTLAHLVLVNSLAKKWRFRYATEGRKSPDQTSKI